MYNTNTVNEKGEVGEGVKFERVRRITGYLTGDINRWNNGKQAELKDRCTHKLTRKADRDREER